MKIMAISIISKCVLYESYKVTFATQLRGNSSQDSRKIQSYVGIIGFEFLCDLL
jgi:hypothetical protein